MLSKAPTALYSVQDFTRVESPFSVPVVPTTLTVRCDMTTDGIKLVHFISELLGPKFMCVLLTAQKCMYILHAHECTEHVTHVP